jgi:hypothetical protein
MPFVGGARIGTATLNTIRTQPIAPKLTHSKLTNVGAFWSPGQGVRPPPGHPPGHGWGLYVTASVHKGQHLQIDNVKTNKTAKTVTITADARGTGKQQKATEKQEAMVGRVGGMKAEKWTVIVKDHQGHTLMKKSMMVGGPPAP